MSYRQSLEGCSLGTHYRDILYPLLSSDALPTFRSAFQEGALAPLSLIEQEDDIPYYKKAAQQFADFEDILILGTGGSSLGGKTFCALSRRRKPQLHFLDNIDPTTFDILFQRLDLKKTGVLAISKSGSTMETLMQLLVCMQQFKSLDLKKHFIAVTESTHNPLRNLALANGWFCLDHPQNVGGRYSCFSIVGLLPAILSGLDPYAFRKGAREVLYTHLTKDMPPALEGAAVSVYLEQNYRKTLSVMLPYADQLDFFSQWYRQLWAESLGKEGKGTTPLRALGTVDQHSQLQLYLDGPKDKFFTLIAPQWQRHGEKINLSEIPELHGKTMGDLFAAEQKATYETLIRNKCPVRLITLEILNEYSLGGLMMHFMIETILTSYLIGVDAFNQPAVEESKRLTREYLAA